MVTKHYGCRLTLESKQYSVVVIAHYGPPERQGQAEEVTEAFVKYARNKFPVTASSPTQDDQGEASGQ